ncbi:MAG: hypothetical protein JXQ82_01725 [Methanomicrobiaceae archaeon]|nr:hypothetical protein [Methanomicrobiaceae archaeon]
MISACTDTDKQSKTEDILAGDSKAVMSADEKSYRIDLNEALLKFRLSTDTKGERNDEITDYLETGGITPAIFQIIGVGVDREGKADTWILGIRYGENESLIYSEITGWKGDIWPGSLPDEEINIDTIIMPAEIFSNSKEITDNLFEKSTTGKTSVMLGEGVYYISPEYSEVTEEIEFNAYTGEVIQEI